jgi:hypothetical protein
MKKAFPYFALAFLAVLLVAVSYYLADQSFSFLGFGEQNQPAAKPDPWRVVLLVVSTLLGITGGYLNTRLQNDTSQAVDLRRELREMLHSPNYYRGIFASPIVFGVIYVAANQQPDDVIAFLLAFENGFFWQRILERREKGVDAPTGTH